MQLAKKRNIVHYRGLGLPAGPPPMSTYTIPPSSTAPNKSVQKPDVPENGEENTPQAMFTSSTPTSSSSTSENSGLSQIPNNTTLQEQSMEQISLAPASPIPLTLSTPDNTNRNTPVRECDGSITLPPPPSSPSSGSGYFGDDEIAPMKYFVHICT